MSPRLTAQDLAVRLIGKEIWWIFVHFAFVLTSNRWVHWQTAQSQAVRLIGKGKIPPSDRTGSSFGKEMRCQLRYGRRTCSSRNLGICMKTLCEQVYVVILWTTSFRRLFFIIRVLTIGDSLLISGIKINSVVGEVRVFCVPSSPANRC